MKRIAMILVAAAALMFVTGTAMAHGGRGYPGRGYGCGPRQGFYGGAPGYRSGGYRPGFGVGYANPGYGYGGPGYGYGAPGYGYGGPGYGAPGFGGGSGFSLWLGR